MMIKAAVFAILFIGTVATSANEANSIAASKDSNQVMYDVGNLYAPLYERVSRHPKLSYLAQDWNNADQWRQLGTSKMQELLAYDEPLEPRNVRILEEKQKEGYRRILLQYDVAPDRQAQAYLLVPDNIKGSAPGILVLHDHGGYYYYGKEKMVETENPVPSLREHIKKLYGGRAIADDLARKGFVVMVPDAFYFGSQRLQIELIPAKYRQGIAGRAVGSDDYIKGYNAIVGTHEQIVARTVFTAGTTWPGIIIHDDRAALSYLLSRKEVDKSKIGCIGLSLGGCRSAYLFGLDSRVKAGVVVGWMTTYSSLLANHLWCHTWMMYVPRQTNYLDLPDIVTLNAPRPLMVINCSQDILFPINGMQDAEKDIKTVYTRMNARDNFVCGYFDAPHSFPIEAQEKAINWFSTQFKNN